MVAHDPELTEVKQALMQLRGRTIYTVTRRSSNTILDADEVLGLLVRTDQARSKPEGEWVGWDDILEMYELLRRQRQLRREGTAVRVHGAFINAAFVCLTTAEIISRKPRLIGYLSDGRPVRLKC